MPVEPLLEHDPLQLGPYKLLARLGSGGMGTVFLAETAGGSAAALKVVKRELARDPEFRGRFAREVEAGRRVAGRCVARFLDADLQAEAPWLATEFVGGPTLHEEVEREGPLVGDRLLALAAGLADALVSIHGTGLVHRDLKPGNVILADDAPKVIDFGVAAAEGSVALTTTGSLVGSPAYMSPEQAEGRRDVGPPADVFSWGSCVVYAARGEPPFGRGEAAGMLYKVVHQPADLAGVPPALLPIVQAALDKDPARRPTALHLLQACAALAGGAPGAAPVPPSPAAAPARTPVAADVTGVLAAAWAPGPAGLARADHTIVQARGLRAALPPRPSAVAQPEPPRRRRGLLVAALCSVLLLALLGGFLALRDDRQETALNSATAVAGEPTATTAGPVAETSSTTTTATPAPVAPGPTAPGTGPAPTVAGSPTPAPGPLGTTIAPGTGTGTGAPIAPAAPTTAGPSAPASTRAPGTAPPPTTAAPTATQLVIDDTSNAAMVRASGPGDWATSTYTKPYQGAGYRTIKAQLTDERPFTFSFLVRGGEQLERTVEAWWTVGEPNDRNTAVPFIVRNADGVELGRVAKSQKVGAATWNPIGRYRFSPGWNTVVVSRITDPARGADIVADAVRITP